MTLTLASAVSRPRAKRLRATVRACFHCGMFNGFRDETIDADGVRIAASIGGDGPPVLLMHGYPQTRWMWRHVAPRLAERYTVVATDLRGYGDSDAPAGPPDGSAYAKRVMALDQVTVMDRLGFGRFAAIGHDRGARVTHRMCLDHPDRIAVAAVIDIVPTLFLFEHTDRAFALAYYHWFFLSQRPDLPERLIGAAPADFLAMTLDRWSGPDFAFDTDSFNRYLSAFDADTIRASCDDYRAAAGVDLIDDAGDRARRVRCPLLVMWGEQGAMHRLYDVPETWTACAANITARSANCGHFVPEEAPDETVAALLDHLASVEPWA